MKEIIYKFNPRGLYETEQGTAFGYDSHLRIIVEPHEFSMVIGGDVLRSTSFDGCTAVASREGEVTVYDPENQIMAQVEKSERHYENVRFEWSRDWIAFEFGCVEVVDYYPNCDGESDRWGERWRAQRTVKLNLTDYSVVVK